jgi:hypothetical protein
MIFSDDIRAHWRALTCALYLQPPEDYNGSDQRICGILTGCLIITLLSSLTKVLNMPGLQWDYNTTKTLAYHPL